MRRTLHELYKKKGSLVAFNVQNILQLSTLYEYAKIYSNPVIAQFSAKYIPYFESNFGFDLLTSKFQRDGVFFHLDHCMDKSTIQFCVDRGFASVMFDGSSLPLPENISLTNEIYAYANARGCLLEAELGSISGVEDGFGSEEGMYYSEDELIRFCDEAKFDMLALAIGNAHGIYSSLEGIDIGKLNRAKELVGEKYLVLHGGTGLPDDMVFDAIHAGVVKINVSTALKVEFMKGLKEFVMDRTQFDQLAFDKICRARLLEFYGSFIAKFTNLQ